MNPIAQAVAQTPPAAEPAKPAEVAKPAPVPDLQAKIAAEQAKRSAERQVKEFEALKKEVEALRPRAAKFDALRTNPEEVLKEVHGDKYYDVLTDRLVNGGRLTPEQVDATIEAKLQALRDEQKTEADKAKADAAEEEKTVRAEWAQQIQTHVAAEPKKYRLTNLHGWSNQIPAFIEQQYKKSQADGAPRLMNNAEGAEAFEAEIRRVLLDSIDDDVVADWQKSRQQTPQQGASASSAPPQLRSLHAGMASGTQTTPAKPMTFEQRKAALLKKLAEMDAANRTQQ